MLSGMAAMFDALDRVAVPLVGRVHGAALGGGGGLASVCDVVVAADDAIFGFTEVKLGLVPSVISPYALARIGRAAARELFLTGARFGAARAKEIGLVHEVVPAAALDSAVERYVAEFLSAGPEAVRAAKTADPRGLGPAAGEGRGTDRGRAGRSPGVGGRPGGPAGVPPEASPRVGGAMIRRLLIANRGEIAVRIIRACRELGVETVAVYSAADARALHVALADAAVAIGPAPASESYLAAGRIIDAARASGADAVHPGYGFLAENAGFAAACADAGLRFVGPPPAVIGQMGSKIEARARAAAAGLPVVPGETPAAQDDAALREAARRIGFPLLVKASAGGGGKGMRTVRDARHLGEALAAARHEAQAAFGDQTLYLERLLERPRHVEIQVFGDGFGNVVHLFERDCSIQRRHQKIVEESPSPGIDAGLRRRMGEAAVSLAKAIGYTNAGTIEFLVEGHGGDARFYFLEMNTRLQVEHPVTEMVAGVDLVHAQLRVASGEPLPWSGVPVVQRGHAIECRVYAEDPASEFLPQAGPLTLYREPHGPGIRVDSGVVEGDLVGIDYDPMIAKLIAWGETREMARQRLLAALRRYPILGIRTNVPFLVRVLGHSRFGDGTLDTSFLDNEGRGLCEARPGPGLAAALAVAAAHDGDERVASAGSPSSPSSDPWTRLAGWRQ